MSPSICLRRHAAVEGRNHNHRNLDLWKQIDGQLRSVTVVTPTTTMIRHRYQNKKRMLDGKAGHNDSPERLLRLAGAIGGGEDCFFRLDPFARLIAAQVPDEDALAFVSDPPRIWTLVRAFQAPLAPGRGLHPALRSELPARWSGRCSPRRTASMGTVSAFGAAGGVQLSLPRTCRLAGGSEDWARRSRPAWCGWRDRAQSVKRVTLPVKCSPVACTRTSAVSPIFELSPPAIPAPECASATRRLTCGSGDHGQDRWW